MILSRTLAAILGGCLLLLTACGSPLQGIDLSSRGPATSEPGYYGKPKVFDPSVTTMKITATAKFRYRPLTFTPTGGTSNGLSNSLLDKEIPKAEFHIYDSTGERIQQGETNLDGTLSFYIPKVAGLYTIKIFSRSENEYLNASILEDLYSNQPYSISKIFNVSASNASNVNFGTEVSPYTVSGTIYAEAVESQYPKIEGGAFNILYQLYQANSYIRQTIGKSNPADFTNKNAWWVADKVTVYWKAGFNPYSYYVSNGSPLSFYLPGEGKLFILGGENGNVKVADTDHFDNSVILHEYGHFLEDKYGFSSSPGGSHNGDFVIDPRLAWSEGWANFFQSAVQSHFSTPSTTEGDIPATPAHYYYVDTFGYKSNVSDTSAGINIAFDMTEDGSLATRDRLTPSALEGEGVYREVSVARSLYKITRKSTQAYVATKYGGGIPFADIWKSFAGEDTNGHRKELNNTLASSLRNKSVYPLPNAGLFNELLVTNTAASTTNMLSILSEEKSAADQLDYATPVTTSVSSCSSEITGIDDPVYPRSYARSHLRRNNGFFLYYHAGGSPTIDLLYKKTANCLNTSCVMDLDLIIYQINTSSPYIYYEDYWTYDNRYYTQAQVTYRRSRRVPASEPTVSGSQLESVSLSGAPAGFYLINVKLNSYGKVYSNLNGTVTYDLKIGSSYLCP